MLSLDIDLSPRIPLFFKLEFHADQLIIYFRINSAI
jgi:hypothetical protein